MLIFFSFFFDDFTLLANAEVQGDDSWTLTDLPFDVEPFLDKQPISINDTLKSNGIIILVILIYFGRTFMKMLFCG